MNLEKEIEELKNKIVMIEEELKKQKTEPKDFELFVKIETEIDNLVIGFNFACNFCVLGRITLEGKCYFLTHEIHREHWEVWKENGFKVAKQEPIVWQGVNWYINNTFNNAILSIFNSKKDDAIFNFTQKSFCPCIEIDNGFLKKDSVGRIHLY